MNYVIENLSQHLIKTLVTCQKMAEDQANSGNEPMIKSLYSVMNSVLHIIESILSQEELPDFYEENLQTIMGGCQFILNQDYPKFQQVPVEIIKARGKVVSLIHCYNFKFGEYFQAYTDPMFESIWQLIENRKV